MTLDRSGMGPERRFFLRLRTRSWVRAVSGSKEPRRPRFSRTRRDTLLRIQETPVNVHGWEVEFQLMSLFVVSEFALNAIRASKSEFKEASRTDKWRIMREKTKRPMKWVVFAIVSLQLKQRERERLESGVVEQVL